MKQKCRGGKEGGKKNNTTGSVYGTANKTVRNEFSRGLEAKRPVSQRCEYCWRVKKKKKKILTRFICINKRDHGNGFMDSTCPFSACKIYHEIVPLMCPRKILRIFVWHREWDLSESLRKYYSFCIRPFARMYVYVQKGNKMLEK